MVEIPIKCLLDNVCCTRSSGRRLHAGLNAHRCGAIIRIIEDSFERASKSPCVEPFQRQDPGDMQAFQARRHCGLIVHVWNDDHRFALGQRFKHGV